jgi:3-oxoadipate enol-lactonase / 4-carboxymuconolactone decarboxylase
MFFRCGEIVVHATAEGPPGAPPVLLLHSVGTALQVWDRQAEALARRYRVWRMDLRGHGLTAPIAGEASIADLAGDVFAMMDAAGLSAAHVAGLSIGGRVAMEMAALRPERVLSLFLLDTALEFTPFAAWDERIALVRSGGMAALREGVLPRWVTDATTPEAQGLARMLLTTPQEGYIAAAAALRDARAAPLAGRIACPAAVVLGADDPATPLAAAEAIRDAIPGATLTALPGFRHIPNFEAAEAVNAALLGHLARATGAAGDAHAQGMAVRRAVLGAAHVARAEAAKTPLDAAFQDYITRNVWGQIWTREGLPRHTRSLLTLAMMAALGRHEEFVLHVKATRNTGVSPEEIAEVLLQVGAYAGVPAANHALKLAKQTLREMEEGQA